MTIIERDKWYFVIDCENCDRGTVVKEAPAPGEVARPEIASISWKCRYCGNRQIIQQEHLQRCQGIYI